MKPLRHPATVIAAAALFMAMGGGAYAAAQKLISGSQIKNHSIPENKLTSSAIAALESSTHAYSSSNTTVEIGGGSTLVDSLTLGAGSYVVMANVSVYNLAADDEVGCQLIAPDNTWLDSVSLSFHFGSGGGQNVASLLAPLTTTGGDVSLKCGGTASGTKATYPRIVAIKVGSVSGF